MSYCHVKEVARGAQLRLMGLPDASTDLNDRAFTTVFGESFHDPVLEVVLGCHSMSMTAGPTPRPRLGQAGDPALSEASERVAVPTRRE